MTGGNPLILPPGLTANQFARYLAKARQLVGDANVEVVTGDHQFVKTDYLDQAKEHDMFYVLDKDYFIASATVAPRNVPEVQELMRLSNEFKVAVWPFSVGRNIGYGGAGPRVPGSVGIDMGRHMNKVLEVNEKDAYCLVEPGVTFQGLYDHLVEKGLDEKLWLDVPDLGGGSVIGNTIERGVGYSPYGDHFMMHCGMEIVLPSGELVRTGMGALPQPGSANRGERPDQQEPNRCWQLFNYGFGPYHDGIFSQSNYGIVVKMGMWLMPNPGGYQAYMVTFENESDLPAIVEIVRQLCITMVIQNVATIRSLLMDAACLADKETYVPGSGGRALTDAELQVIQDKLKIGRWNFYGALYGPEPVRNALWGAIQGSFATIPGAKFYLHEEGKANPGVLDIRAKTMRGIPTYDELKWVDWVPNGAHFFFSPISEVRGEAATLQAEITKRRLEAAGFDVIIDFLVGMREMHNIVCLVYDRKKPEERARALKVIRELIDECAALGWGEYRTHLALMDQIAGTYNFNDNALMKFSETLKDAIDPNGILAPGKNGVWPRTYNKAEWKLDANSSPSRQSLPHVAPQPKLLDSNTCLPFSGPKPLLPSKLRQGTARIGDPTKILMSVTRAWVRSLTVPSISTQANIDVPTLGEIEIPTGLHIDGKWVTSALDETFSTINPATGEKLVDVAHAGKEDVDAAVAAARRAFKTTWGMQIAATERARFINRLADLLERDANKIAAVESLNAGKGIRIAREADVADSVACLRYYAGMADKIHGQTIDAFGGTKLAYTLHQPIGVCGQIIPWNYPLQMWAWKVAPALAAGCTVVMKPSELTPLTALMMNDLVAEAEIPAGVVNTVPGLGATTGDAIARHMGIDKVAFTGSVPTGKRISIAAAESNLKKVTLELGGKSPMIIFNSADTDEAADWTANGIWYNSGQDCCASSRIYVQANVFDRYVNQLRQRALTTAIGQPSDEKTSFGPLISAAQRDKVLSYIDSGKAEGARLVSGGRAWPRGGEGFFVEPTILANSASKDLKVGREEIFGPVVVVTPFRDEAHAIEMANDTEYGLAAAVFTNDTRQATRVARALDAGSVWVNQYGAVHNSVPFGGFKQSGIGRELGTYGLEAYLQVKAVHHNISVEASWPI